MVYCKNCRHAVSLSDSGKADVIRHYKGDMYDSLNLMYCTAQGVTINPLVSRECNKSKEKQ